MSAEATALAVETPLRTRMNKSGWHRTDNPHYRADYNASDQPWFVPQRVWTRKTTRPDHDRLEWRVFVEALHKDDYSQPRPEEVRIVCWERIARCYDTRPR